MSCLLLITMLRLTCGKRETWKDIKKSETIVITIARRVTDKNLTSGSFFNMLSTAVKNHVKHNCKLYRSTILYFKTFDSL